MKQMDFADGWQGLPRRRPVSDLGQVETQLLWALRRMARLRPIGSARCHATHASLQRHFGDAGLAVEHLLRCCLVGLSRRAAQPLGLGEPACPFLTDDEVRLLDTLRLAGHDRVAASRLLGGFGTAAQALLPLVAALSDTVAPFVANRRSGGLH